MEQYLSILFNYLMMIPGAILCYAPMQEQLRYSKKRLIIIGSAVIAATSPFFAYAEMKLNDRFFLIYLAYCILVYLIYRRTLDIDSSKSLMIFSTVMVWMYYTDDFSILIDSRIHPEGPSTGTFARIAAQLVIGLILTVLFINPMKKYGSELIASFHDKKVWCTGAVVCVVFIIICTFLTPKKYETLYVNNVRLSYTVLVTTTFFLHLLLCVIYYFIISGLIRSKKAEEENKLYAMRESYYVKQQRYIDEHTKARYLFRKTIRALKELVDSGDMDSLKELINKYYDELPENDTITYCGNQDVNAVLNYYHHLAEQLDIYTNWQIDIPESTKIKNSDLCNVIGNILENAIAACREIPESERRIQLTIVCKHNANLYIVATNNFSGKVKLSNDQYLSTNRDGDGIGLTSIESIAESYGGAADFRHEDNTFYTNVVLTAPDA